VTGQSASTQTSFPVVVGPDLIYNSAGTDPYVGKVDPSGEYFLYLGYVGTGRGLAIAVDGFGAAYLTGDMGVVKVDPSGASLVYNSLAVAGNGIAVDAAGAAYVVGQTNGSLPSTPDLDTTYGGQTDAFIAKLAPSGASVVYAGFIGGAGTDIGAAAAVDPNGCAYAAGQTATNNGSFPVLVGPQLSFNGGTRTASSRRSASDPGGTTTTSTSTTTSTTVFGATTSTTTTITTTTSTTTIVTTTTTTITTTTSTTTIVTTTTTTPRASTTTRRTTTSTTTTSTTLPIDPFLCYRTKLKRPVQVTLADAFDAGTYQGSGAWLFCLPAQIGGATVRDTSPISPASGSGPPCAPEEGERRHQMAGFPLTIDTKKADTLFVPSVMGPSLAPDPANGVDHYRCVKIRISQGTECSPSARSCRSPISSAVGR
jgi:hypothetical protein